MRANYRQIGRLRMRVRRQKPLLRLAGRLDHDRPEVMVEALSQSPSANDAESIARNTGFAFAAQITSAAFTAALFLFLVRALDPVGYGLLGLAGAIGGLLLLPADFGVSKSAARFIAERRGDRAAAASIISAALRLKLAITGTTSVLLFATAGVIASAYGEPGLTWVLRGIALAICAESLMLLLTYAFVARGKTSLNLGTVFIESSVEMAASVALVLLGAGAAGAAFGRAMGYAAGLGIALLLTISMLGRSVVARPPRGDPWSRRILRYGGAVLIVDSAYTLFNAIDVLVIGAFLTATAVGLFSAPMRLVALFQLPAVAISTAVSPRMAKGFAPEREADSFVRALSYIALFQVALIPPLLVWPEPIVRLILGPNYEGSVNVLRALTPFVFLLGFGSILSVTANYLGQARRRVPIAMATVAINVVIDLALIPRIGIVGGAIGTDVAYGFYAAAHLLICRQVLQIPLHPLAVTILRAAVAGAAMAAVLLAFGTHQLSWPEVVLGSALGLLAYLACLAALGLVGRSERRRLFGI
jgi:O-antigen/teichoic acid export membrane protein